METERHKGEPGDGPPADNQSSDPHGATVNETGRPVVVVGVYGLTDEQVARLRESAAGVPICPHCLKHNGACPTCLAHVGPSLRRNPIAKDTHSGKANVLPEPLSPEAAKVKRRKERKAATRAAEPMAPVAPAIYLVTEPLIAERRKKARGRRQGMLGLVDALKAA